MKTESRSVLVSAAAGVVVGALSTFFTIGWVVMAANGVRDQAILGATEAVKKCGEPATTQEKQKHAPPRRWRL